MTSKIAPIASSIALTAIISACQQPVDQSTPKQGATTNTDEQKIRDLLMNNERMLSIKNLDGWLDQLADDAIMMPPESKVVTKGQTRDVYGTFWENKDMDYDYNVVVDEIGVHGDWAFARWHYAADFTNVGDGTTITEHAKELSLFKRQDDGAWKFSHIMWNLNEPFDPVYSIPGDKAMTTVNYEVSAIDESDVRNMIEADYNAWDTADVDALVKHRYGLGPGFGFRTRQARRTEGPMSDSELRQFLTSWFDSLEYYNIWVEDLHIRTSENVGLAWGTHVEDFKHKGAAPEKVTVRFTQTYQRQSSGEIVPVQAHRDIQPFDDSGAYIPQGNGQ